MRILVTIGLEIDEQHREFIEENVANDGEINFLLPILNEVNFLSDAQVIELELVD